MSGRRGFSVAEPMEDASESPPYIKAIAKNALFAPSNPVAVDAWGCTLAGMKMPRVFVLLALSCLLIIPMRALEPPNLSVAKEAVIRYADTGDYERDIAEVVGYVRDWLEARVARQWCAKPGAGGGLRFAQCAVGVGVCTRRGVRGGGEPA
jgi:hypothetical protein